MISENLRESSIKKIQLTIKECREQRKKTLDEYNKIKRQFDKQHDLLIKVCRRKNYIIKISIINLNESNNEQNH